MSEDANKKGEREFQKEMLKIQPLNHGINSRARLAISWLVLSVGSSLLVFQAMLRWVLPLRSIDYVRIIHLSFVAWIL
jgi:hypothetical protein